MRENNGNHWVVGFVIGVGSMILGLIVGVVISWA